MRLRPSPHLPFFFVLASTGAACQLVNGIGDELTYEPGDGGDAADASRDVTVDHTVPQTDSGDARVTTDADATTLIDADATAQRDADADARDEDVSNGDGAPSAEAPPCPVDAGTAMVLIKTLSGWSYCIDVTEVTLDQLSVYSATFPTMGPDVPPACKTDAALAEHIQAPSQPGSYPASGVNFCYAWDYCKRIGKRLCGNIGGGPVTSTASGEWYYACANGAPPTTYPYGDAFDPDACVTGATGPSPVGSHPACHGKLAPLDAVLDMSGNLAEFDQTASSLDGSESSPVVTSRGGTYNGTGAAVSCSTTDDVGMYTALTNFPPSYGFRCCADAK